MSINNSKKFKRQENRKIIFIASYPKSGNTWLRLIVCCLLYLKEKKIDLKILNNIGLFSKSDNFEFFNDKKYQKNGNLDFNWIISKWIKSQKIINKTSAKNIFFKTHNVQGLVNNHFFTDETTCLGFIYIVRDPRDVAVSLAKHMGINYDDAINEMLFNSKRMTSHKKVNEFVSTWKNNVSSWMQYKKVNSLILKYEDLINHEIESIEKISKFISNITNLKFDFSKNKIIEISKLINFKNLQNIEKDKGFIESSCHSKFFREGSSGSWKNKLKKKQYKLIERELYKEMGHLSYY